ncbi:MAG: SpoVG family protein [Clostridiales bacterium]|nr:SpoVG family protein [Clostridiales bacterium]
MDIQADMKILNRDDIMATGTVTIDGLITINEVIVRNIMRNDGTKDCVVFLPRRKTGENEWKDVFEVSKEVKKEIDAAVGSSIKEALHIGYEEPKVEASVTVYLKNDLLGYATLNYENEITIRNIRIYKADNQYGIRLVYPSYKGEKDEKWHNLVSVDGFLFDDVICQKVSEAYEKKVKTMPTNRRAAI